MADNCELTEPSNTEQPPSVKASADRHELQVRYEEQLRRLGCPSCGEEPFLG